MARIKDLDLLKDINILYENDIILYGAGNYGRKACELLTSMKIPILGFCDSNVTKWGGIIDEYRVMSLYEMKNILKEKDRVIIIITIAEPDSVEQVPGVLEKFGMAEIGCYTYFALKHTIEFHIDDDRIEETFRKDEKMKKKLYCDYWHNMIEHITFFTLWDVISKPEKCFVILQPGKVGSTSVRNSLERAKIPSYNLHRFTDKWGKKPIKQSKEGLLLLQKADKVRMISLVRDPIARGISVYFQCFHEYIIKMIHDIFEPDTYKGVTALLKEEMGEGRYGFMFEWFNMEIRDTFGIDVYQYDFDREKGFSIIQQDNIELLLIKLEKLNECEEIIGQFVGIENFKLIKSNDADHKLYRFAYEELKKTIKIPQNILDFYYKDNSAMDHFYTSEEKEQFYKKWLKRR